MNHNCITLPVIEDAINNVACLFSLPDVYLRIQELMNDSNSDLDDFCKVVSTDPNLAASVLKIVNSAYFGFTGQVESIHRALNILGIGPLHDLVLSISAVGAFSMPNQVIELSKFWRRSIYCGVLSKLIAEKIKVKDSGNLFVIGLLHDIGHLLLCFKFPEQSIAALTESAQTNRLLVQIEPEIFSIHYGQVGQKLMQVWNLPLKFQTVTAFHPEPASATDYRLETAIVHIAQHYAYAKEMSIDPLDLIDPCAWQMLDLTPEFLNEVLSNADILSREMEQMITRK